MSQMSSKLKQSLKQIISDVNRKTRQDYRNLLLRTAAAMGSAYHASQVEYARNASIPVKYAVLDRFDADLAKYRERVRLPQLQDRFTSNSEPAYYRGLRLAVHVEEYELTHRTGHILIELLDVRLWDHSHVTFEVDDVKLVKVEETVTIWLPEKEDEDDCAAHERLTWMLLA